MCIDCPNCGESSNFCECTWDEQIEAKRQNVKEKRKNKPVKVDYQSRRANKFLQRYGDAA